MEKSIFNLLSNFTSPDLQQFSVFELSPLKIKVKIFNSFVNMTRTITLKIQLKFCVTSGVRP